MDPDDPDLDELFAPLKPADALGVVLNEAHDVLSQVHEPVDAELWGSDIIGALSGSAGETDSVMDTLTTALVPAAEEAATPEALALLRIFGAIGSPALRSAATEAADRVAAKGVPEPNWATAIGMPQVSECWHYGDVGGRQESVTMTFAYGDKQHAVSVLVDHGHGGKVKDAWVGDAAGMLEKTWLTAESDPLVVFETLAPAEAHDRLRRAVAAGECPEQPDQAEDVAAHRALLHARLDLLSRDTPPPA